MEQKKSKLCMTEDIVYKTSKAEGSEEANALFANEVSIYKFIQKAKISSTPEILLVEKTMIALRRKKFSLANLDMTTLELRELLIIWHSITKSLAALNAHKISHGNIKQSHVIYDDLQEMFLIDFKRSVFNNENGDILQLLLMFCEMLNEHASDPVLTEKLANYVEAMRSGAEWSPVELGEKYYMFNKIIIESETLDEICEAIEEWLSL
jgi:predicted Ser/Thr protein kinase